MASPAEIAARQAVLAKFKATFNNDFVPSYNAALQGIKAWESEYGPMIAALKAMAAAVNAASPAITEAIRETQALSSSPREFSLDPPIGMGLAGKVSVKSNISH